MHVETVSAFFDYVNANTASFALELAGALSGLICVWLLVRESVWTWPLGLLYAVISLFIFYGERLYSDWVLHLYYVGMNAYGWYYWTRKGAERNVEGNLQVVRMPVQVGVIATVLTVVGLIAWGRLVVWALPDADLVYWDSATTVMSFAAMWLTARKYLESWAVWLLVDILLTGIYIYKGIMPYAVLYAIYIGMAVWGWMAWARTMREVQGAPTAA